MGEVLLLIQQLSNKGKSQFLCSVGPTGSSDVMADSVAPK